MLSSTSDRRIDLQRAFYAVPQAAGVGVCAGAEDIDWPQLQSSNRSRLASDKSMHAAASSQEPATRRARACSRAQGERVGTYGLHTTRKACVPGK